ncbi:hypothetical protein BH747_04310 [Enterococcus villorum]|uniref:Uncharacterized protein n=2 Tax=Enterococcus villorum TaxID=112904 RepID=A0A1V8YIJ2_9ENTE|nr:hypothetical protein BH747_04310 [Enterococcus villorum]OQO72434.1 hypothetical protein BH744_11555 [Enterococcus villorum]
MPLDSTIMMKDGSTKMNKFEQERIKEEILSVMNDVKDKNNEGYQQLLRVLEKTPYETNKEYEQLLKQFQEKKSNIETKEGKKLLELLKKQPTVTMEEVVESCVYFQKISDNTDLQKLFFDLLIESKVEQLNQLVLLKSLSVTCELNSLLEDERKSLNRELKAGCIELQYDMESIETKNIS